MTGIKVTYQSTIRRFTVPNTVTWSDLESKLRSVFSLPPTFEFSLSYKDEDGDTITLSTDLELQEFITYQPPQSTLRFHLVPEGKQNVIVAENDFVSVQEERFIPDDVTEPDSHVTELDVDVTDDDESYFEPTPPSGSKGKQKESPAEPQTSAANDKQQEENQSPPSNDDNKRQAPFIDLAEQFQQLIGQFDDVISNNPQLVEQVDNIMEQILRNIPVDIDQLARWLNTFRPEGGETDHPRGEQQQRQQQQRQQQQRQQQRPANDFGPFGNFSPFIPPHVLSNPWVQKAFHDVSANYSGLGNFGNLSGRTGSGCPYRQQQREEELSQEALKEKITLLHKMGFWEDDIKNEELLKKYNGNVERVVEKLIEEKYGRQ